MSYFWDTIEEYGENAALISEEETVSYKQLSQISDRIAGDVPVRSFVFLVCRNQIAAIAGYVAFLRKRVVFVLINESIDRALFDHLKDIYGPQYIWCPEGFSEEPGTYSYGGYKLISTGNLCPEMKDDLAMLVTTSGSTGSPKFVRLSYQNIQANTESIIAFLNITASDRAITTLPMSYVYGLSILQTHLKTGAAIIVTEKSLLDAGFWNLFKKTGATTFGSVTYMYQLLMRLRFLKMDLSSLRYITQAGGKLGEDLHRQLADGMLEKGKKFFAMYGASEATARMSYVPWERSVEKAGSIGIAVPGGRFELTDADGNLISENEKVGELVYYGPNVMLGYAQDREDLSKDDEMYGRLATGDLAKRDSDGYYYIVGRKNRYVKIFGNRVSLAELEDLLSANGYETACVGENDHIRIYTTSAGYDGIVDYVSKKTGLNAAAFTAVHLKDLPRNQAGKILYSELQ